MRDWYRDSVSRGEILQEDMMEKDGLSTVQDHRNEKVLVS